MNKNRNNSERVVAVVGLAFVLIAAITSLFFNGDPKSIIEKVADTKIVIPVVHFICVFLTLILVIISQLPELPSIQKTHSCQCFLRHLKSRWTVWRSKRKMHCFQSSSRSQGLQDYFRWPCRPQKRKRRFRQCRSQAKAT